jgi:hypothetical protein
MFNPFNNCISTLTSRGAVVNDGFHDDLPLAKRKEISSVQTYLSEGQERMSHRSKRVPDGRSEDVLNIENNELYKCAAIYFRVVCSDEQIED